MPGWLSRRTTLFRWRGWGKRLPLPIALHSLLALLVAVACVVALSIEWRPGWLAAGVVALFVAVADWLWWPGEEDDDAV